MLDSKVLKRRKSISYAKWGYFFITPFFLVYFVFSFIPLISTFYNSFFETYRMGLIQVGPNFIGFDNYVTLFTNTDFFKFALNTLIIWVAGFIPQILIALLLAVWFTSTRLNLKGQAFFKTVTYMPNIIMASALAMLFFSLFSDSGPINQMLISWGIVDTPYRFMIKVGWVRTLIANMNFLLWFGHTTILLMAGIMGIDQGLFEAATVDGAKPTQVFFKITLPLLTPILVYVMITALIGGIQMFDVPQILTNGDGMPNRTSMTMIMYLNNHLHSKNYGMAGAVSFVIFIMTAILGIFVYKTLMINYKEPKFDKIIKKSKKRR
jgi:multiple sugar transport system permease protein